MGLIKTVDERSAMLRELDALCDSANATQHEIDGLHTCLVRVLRPLPPSDDNECSYAPKRRPETVEEAIGELRQNVQLAHRRLSELRHRLQLG